VDRPSDVGGGVVTQARWNDLWRTVAVVLSIAAVLVGLAMAAAAVLFVVALNSWGSNK
jgi:hypothetical protein